MRLAKIYSFVSSEKKYLDTKNYTILGLALYQIVRNYKFLQIINKRYKKSSSLFISTREKFRKTLGKRPKGVHTMTRRQIKLARIEDKAYLQVHLEIESFYLFAKILLDKLARIVEFYFGQTDKLSLDSHHLFCKNIKEYSSFKSILIDYELIEHAKKLKKDISDFRDFQIAHHKNFRIFHGINFSDKNVKIILQPVYPKPNDKEMESKSIDELLDSIDKYFNLILDFLNCNRNKSKTSLEIKKDS